MANRSYLLKRIIEVVNNIAPDAEIYLYGSQAKGKAKKMSDWDLLILLNSKNVSFQFETKLMDDFYDVEVDTGEIISPMIYTKKEWQEQYSLTSFFENIITEGFRIK